MTPFLVIKSISCCSSCSISPQEVLKKAQNFADAISDTNSQAQSVLTSARDSLISLGLKGSEKAATGGLVLGGLSFYLDMFDQGVQAGLKNVKAYIEHENKAIREGETGVKERPPEVPQMPAPPELQTYAGQRLYEKLDKLGTVNNAGRSHPIRAARAPRLSV